MTTMIGYLRVSTDERAASGLGSKAQRDTIQRYADDHGWKVAWYVDEGKSAKNMDRPELQAALARLHPRKRNVAGLVVAKLDCLSRAVPDFAGVLDACPSATLVPRCYRPGRRHLHPTGELIANVMMSVAPWERRIIGERTSAAMQAAARRGKHMGRLSALPAVTGDRLLALKRSGLTLAGTAEAMNAEGLATATGVAWTVNTVAKVHKRLTANLTKDTTAAPAALAKENQHGSPASPSRSRRPTPLRRASCRWRR